MDFHTDHITDEGKDFFNKNKDTFLKLSQQKDKEDLMRFINDGIKMHPGSSFLYSMRAGRYNEQKDYIKALEDAVKALIYNPKNLEVLTESGEAKMGLNDYAGAEKDFLRAINYDPTNCHAYELMGRLLLIQEKYKESKFYFEEAIRVASEQDTPGLEDVKNEFLFICKTTIFNLNTLIKL